MKSCYPRYLRWSQWGSHILFIFFKNVETKGVYYYRNGNKENSALIYSSFKEYYKDVNGEMIEIPPQEAVLML